MIPVRAPKADPRDRPKELADQREPYKFRPSGHRRQAQASRSDSAICRSRYAVQSIVQHWTVLLDSPLANSRRLHQRNPSAASLREQRRNQPVSIAGALFSEGSTGPIFEFGTDADQPGASWGSLARSPDPELVVGHKVFLLAPD